MNKQFMQEAISISLAMMRQGQGGPFGAVVVKDNQIVGRGWNQVTSTNDPTAHAEVVAIRDACRTLGSFRLSGCELYTSCEPCPMCLSAAYWAHLDNFFYGCGKRDATEAGFDDDFIYQELALPSANRKLVSCQFMREEALVAFQEWKVKPDKIRY